ncbi:hypothetical protein PMIN05_010422 [Paraphaeosphaeria minitans]
MSTSQSQILPFFMMSQESWAMLTAAGTTINSVSMGDYCKPPPVSATSWFSWWLQTPTTYEGIVHGVCLLVYAGESPAKTLQLPGSRRHDYVRITVSSQEPE